MRDIKFKFWCKGTSDNLNFNKPGWWRYPNYLLCKYHSHLDIFDSEDFIACQYTGLKDKNGVEIYEGDIVKGYHEVYDSKQKTKFRRERYTGIIHWNHSYFAIGEYKFFIMLDETLQVIGNVYENPELLNTKE